MEQSRITKDIAISENMQWRCPKCPESFVHRVQLLYHLSFCNLKARRFRCLDCAASFPFESDLNRHKKICGKKRPAVCLACGKFFKENYTLRKHWKQCTVLLNKGFKTDTTSCTEGILSTISPDFSLTSTQTAQQIEKLLKQEGTEIYTDYL